MNGKPIEILFRPTYETIFREMEYDPSDAGDPDKADPASFAQGFRTERRLVDPGKTFEIARGWEGCIGKTRDKDQHVRIIAPSRCPPDNKITDFWGLRPGRYLYDGKDVQIVEFFLQAGATCNESRQKY